MHVLWSERTISAVPILVHSLASFSSEGCYCFYTFKHTELFHVCLSLTLYHYFVLLKWIDSNS